jgi:hypothetical protein
MEKIYTLTFQRVLNYGAALQAYGLSKFLSNSGFDVEVIDYLPNYFFMQTMLPAKSFKRTVDKYIKYQQFKQFRERNLPLSAKIYYTQKSLYLLPEAYAVVCGSDQIWNHRLTGGKLDKSFYLNFVKEGARKIAFAASAGSIRLKDTKESVLPLLNSFSNLGVREAVMAEDITSMNPELSPEIVVDPSLLINDYSEVLLDEFLPDSDYVVSYVVGSGEMLFSFNQRVNELKKLTNLKVIHLGAKAISAADKNVLNIGPGHWASFIKNASFVITNSFHGTAFALNFGKDFIVIPHKIDNLNQRQKTLLLGIGLEDRLLIDNQEIEEKHLRKLNYGEIKPKLDGIISKSRDFLLGALI